MTIQDFPEELQLLRDLSRVHGLGLVLDEMHNPFLVGADFVVAVNVDREGVRYWYFDVSDGSKVTQYALDYLVVRKRAGGARASSDPLDNRDRVRAELQIACHDLKNLATDVLSGSRTWFNQYDFGTIDVHGDPVVIAVEQ